MASPKYFTVRRAAITHRAINEEGTAMEERTFDLTIPVTRLFRIFWITYGVMFVILGFLNMSDKPFLGALQLALGLIALPFMGLLNRINKYIIAFKDGNLEIDKGLFIRRRISWSSISEIRIQLMKLEFGLDSGKSVKIDFTAMSYNDNRMIKPEIIAAANAFAEAKGIEVKDSRA